MSESPGSTNQFVGIVLVSHSAAVAASVAELATDSRAARRPLPSPRPAAPWTAVSAPAPN